MAKLTGIKKAVGEFNRWPEHAEIMFDRDTWEIWSRRFNSSNDYMVDHDAAIIQLCVKGLKYNTKFEKTSMKIVKQLVTMALNGADARMISEIGQEMNDELNYPR